MSIKVAIFAGSIRKGSFNQMLANNISQAFRKSGFNVTDINLNDYTLPLYNSDYENEMGMPDAALKLHEALAVQDMVFIASPEYNANLSPLLINTVSWLSRIDNAPKTTKYAFKTKLFVLGSASPGHFGGYRGLLSLRHSLELQLGAYVLPEMISISRAHEAFEQSGAFKNEMYEQLTLNVISNINTFLK